MRRAGGLAAVLLLSVVCGVGLRAQDGAGVDAPPPSPSTAERLAVHELLANPRLEHGAAGWALTAGEPVQGLGRDGGDAVRLFSAPDATPRWAVMQSFVPGLEPGRHLELSVRARGSTTSGFLRFMVKAGSHNDFGSFELAKLEGTLDLDPEAWGSAALQFYVPVDTTWMSVGLAASGACEVFVDEVSLHPVDPQFEPDPELAESVGQLEFDALVTRAGEFVERVRGRPFTQPPRAQLLRRDDFLRAFPRPGRGESEQRVRPMLRLLGVVPQGFDFDAAWTAVEQGPPSGRWVSWLSTAAVRGDVLRDMLPTILVHELTHAFDRDATQEWRDSALERGFDTDGVLARRAVIEGIAMTVQARWSRVEPGSVAPREPADVLTHAAAEWPAALVPGYFPMMYAMPYAAGWAFFEHAIARAPDRTLDDVFLEVLADPPTSAAQILHPELYWGADRHDVAPVLPELDLAVLDDAGWTLQQVGVLGEPLLALATGHAIVFSEDLEAMRALRWTHAPSEGWVGDAWQLFRSPGGYSVVLVSAWRDAFEAAEFAAAVSLPHPFEVDRSGDLVFVSAADDAQDLDVLRAALHAELPAELALPRRAGR